MILFVNILYFNLEVINIFLIVYKNVYLRNRKQIQREGEGHGRAKPLAI
jgi:hypothetical protein